MPEQGIPSLCVPYTPSNSLPPGAFRTSIDTYPYPLVETLSGPYRDLIETLPRPSSWSNRYQTRTRHYPTTTTTHPIIIHSLAPKGPKTGNQHPETACETFFSNQLTLEI